MSYAYMVLKNGIPVAGGPSKYHCRHWLQSQEGDIMGMLDNDDLTVWRVSSRYEKPNPTNISEEFKGVQWNKPILNARGSK